MSQTATIKFNSEPETGPKRAVAGKFFVILLILAVACAAFFYWQHFKHSQLPPTASAAVPAVQQPATPIPKPVAETVLPAKRIPLQPVVAPRSEQKPIVLTAEQKRLKVAQSGFEDIMAMAAGHPDVYGFQRDEDLGAARLGKELPLYTIKPLGGDKFTKQPVSSLLQPMDVWLYPIISNNHVRYIVKVQSDGHNYVLGEGSRSLAMSYDKILAQWPAVKGFHPQLITVPNLPAYYFSIPELPNQNITDTDRMLDYIPDLSPASIVLANCE